MKFEFCKICHGINKLKCLFCKMSLTDYRKLGPEEFAQCEHTLYLNKMWLKLKKFEMFTSGDFRTDEELMSLWGRWCNSRNAAAESYARDILRGEKFPEYLRNCQLGQDIERLVAELRHGILVGLLESDGTHDNDKVHR